MFLLLLNHRCLRNYHWITKLENDYQKWNELEMIAVDYLD